MANEAVIIELLGAKGDKGCPIRFTVSNTTTIEKGTILKLSDPRTAAAASADGDIFCGIAAAEKVANDGATTLAAWTKGIFDLKCTGGCTAGEMLKISGANLVDVADDDTAENAGEVIGMALETASANEVIAVAVGVY